jgi:hypothetical protein
VPLRSTRPDSGMVGRGLIMDLFPLLLIMSGAVAGAAITYAVILWETRRRK